MRRFTLLLFSAVLLAAACGSDSKDSSSKSSATTASGSAAATSAAGGTAAAVTQPKGELKLGFGIHMPGTLDATKSGFELTFVGAAEQLYRLDRDQKAQPWLAESIKQIDPATYQVALRKNAKFWDGTPVTAQDVIASFQRAWETQPASAGFIPKDTELTAIDATTVQFKAKQPLGAFTNSLSTYQFTIHKPGQNGQSILTGPYKAVELKVDQQLTLEAFTDYWGGVPPIAKITIKAVPDPNARALALQSGEVDMIFNLPPQLVSSLPGDFEKIVIPSTRQHLVLLNPTKGVFSDKALREATAYAIDRAALNKVALDGLGAVATNIFPPNPAVEIVPAQSTDVNKARQLLDDAGWKAGGDGVRVKDGKRLAFTLYSYPGRAELTPMAVAIQGQLKPLGYDIQIQQVPDISAQLKDGNFDATMYSLGTLPTGDPFYIFNLTLSKSGSANPGGYSNPRADALLDQLRVETDGAKRAELSKQLQEINKADVPGIYLVGAPLGFFYKKGKVQGFTPNPNDLYFIDRSFSVK